MTQRRANATMDDWLDAVAWGIKHGLLSKRELEPAEQRWVARQLANYERAKRAREAAKAKPETWAHWLQRQAGYRRKNKR